MNTTQVAAAKKSANLLKSTEEIAKSVQASPHPAEAKFAEANSQVAGKASRIAPAPFREYARFEFRKNAAAAQGETDRAERRWRSLHW